MSKLSFKHIAGIALTAAVISSTANASPISASGTVNDNYWGADPTGNYSNRDIIGSSSNFNVRSMNWSLEGTILEIRILTDFALSGLGTFGSYTKADPNGDFAAGSGISFGDLFLSSSWNPVGSAANKYSNDNMYNGTKWEYGFSLDNRLSSTGGEGDWYDLTGCADNQSCIHDSNDYLQNAIFREGQEISVDRDASGVTAIQQNTWSISGSNPGEVIFNFNIAGTNLEYSETIAFHWAMSCGNDTIEGEFSKPVPEPASMALLSISIAGLGLVRRRKQS